MRTVTRIRVPHGWMTFIYNHAGLVMHPDILDAIALLDAAADARGDAVIEGLGTRVEVDRTYANNDHRNFTLTEYTLHGDTWRQS